MKNTQTIKKDMTIRNVDEDLRRRFKKVCAFREKPMNEEIQRLMREEIERANKELAKRSVEV